MKKGIFIFILLILALFSVSCVCAIDADDAIAISEDTSAIELAQSDEIDEITASDDSQTVEQSDDEELILEDNDVDKPILGEKASTGSFTDLDDLINNQYGSNDTITLSCNYTFNGTDDDDSGFIHGIIINRGVTIDGNGCTIDGSQKARIFNIGKYGAVKFLNINFINGKATGSGEETDGGAIMAMYRNCVVEGCNFTNNTAKVQGGALMRVTAYNCTFTGNTAADGGAIDQGSAYNCTFTGNTAKVYGGAISFGSAYNCVFTGNTAHDNGGAIDNGDAYNCVFTGNTASDDGGAIFYGSAYNCVFTGNTASDDGGAMRGFDDNPEYCSATLCMFDSNTPNDYRYIRIVNVVLSADDLTASYNSGDRLLFNLTADNTNYVGFNTTIKIYQDGQVIGTYYALSGEGWIVDLNPGTYNAVLSLDKYEGVTNGTATITITDGTTFWDLNKTINGNTNDTITLNNNYTYNSASDSAFTEGIVINRPVTINGNGYTINANGKARIFQITGNDVVLENITFINGHTTSYGGAIRFTSSCTVTNCNFTNNSAQYGGAIRLGLGNLTNCNFINNTAANYGGALLMANGNVSNCNFINNTAENGGAIRFNGDGAVTNCNFTYNNATIGSAIYFYSTSATKNVSNSIFLNNRAKAEVLDVVKNDNNIIITFTGQNNLLNAIFSRDDAKVTFTNVTYWGKNGLATISDTISGSNGEVGQNITVIMVVNDILILNTTEVTDENGQIVLDAVAGNCTITALHIEDSYYTYAETTETFNITGNETPLKLNVSGHTVTAALSPDIAAANVTFTLSNESGVVKKVQIALTDGVGELDLTGLIGDYNITATYGGNINYYPCIATISISDEVPFNVSDAIISFGDVANIVVGVPEAINGQNISISVNGTSKNATAKEGKAIADFTDLPAGEYLIIVDYFGDGYHSANSTTMNLTVNKVDSILNVDDVVLDYGTSANVTVTIEGATGIIAKINDKEAVVENSTISIPVLDVGTYTLTVTAIADSNHNNITKNVTITVNKAKTQIDAKAVTATYNVNKNLVITLKDANGKALSGVKITVQLKNTKTYTTNKNGQVKISTKGLAPKKYTAKITFNGDKNYAKSTKDVKVTVKKVKSKIYAKKKTFKTSVKTKKYTITLKDNTGKAIKKAKVTLKVKGKTYMATTNSKGKAVFKIKNLKKKGTFKATITYKGNKYYNKVSKKANIKVIVTFKTVSKGSKDKSTVKEIQQALKDHGYYLSYKGHYLKVDGKFQSCTERSVKEFQKDKGLKVTGKVDEKAAKKLGLI
ncbi:peptidoglycan-binding protein [Methanobrevibacter thaueri]|uniref:peptidoglycan-binding protein n=1 Tax=Methanobrevibacter thaueri TaxID=190975 RepID=UPI00386E27B4